METKIQLAQPDMSVLAIGTARRTWIAVRPGASDDDLVVRVAQGIANRQGQHLHKLDRETGFRAYEMLELVWDESEVMPEYDPALGICYISGVPGMPEIRTLEELGRWVRGEPASAAQVVCDLLGVDAPTPVAEFEAAVESSVVTERIEYQ